MDYKTCTNRERENGLGGLLENLLETMSSVLCSGHFLARSTRESSLCRKIRDVDNVPGLIKVSQEGRKGFDMRIASWNTLKWIDSSDEPSLTYTMIQKSI